MEEYKCKVCKQNHDIYRGLDIPLPRIMVDMTDQERVERVEAFNRFYFVDGKSLYASAYLNINLEKHDTPFFFWKVWVLLPHIGFLKILERLSFGEDIELDGMLESDLPYYPDTKNLKSKVLIKSIDDELQIEVLIVEDCQLKEDQIRPITKTRMIEMMQMIHHPPKEK